MNILFLSVVPSTKEVEKGWIPSEDFSPNSLIFETRGHGKEKVWAQLAKPVGTIIEPRGHNHRKVWGN